MIYVIICIVVLLLLRFIYCCEKIAAGEKELNVSLEQLNSQLQDVLKKMEDMVI